MTLIGKATAIHAYDNSSETDNGLPLVRLVFRMRGRKIVEPNLATLFLETQEWAKPLVVAAVRQGKRRP